MKRIRPRGILVTLALAIGSVTLWCAQRPDLDGDVLERPNWREDSIVTGETTRWYRIYVPESLPAQAPLVLLLHGRTQSMRRVFAFPTSGTREWVDLADEESFLLVVPNGTNGTGGDTRGDRQKWNDVRGLDSTMKSRADDVGFLNDLLDRIEKDYSIDASRVYVTGASNGGMMTFRLLIETPERFAAGAAFIASLPETSPLIRQPAAPTPLMIANGTKDPLIKWDGGENLIGRSVMRPVEETVAWWVRANHAVATNPVNEALPDSDSSDGCRVRRTTYPAGREGAPVVFYTFDGGGHAMPSRKHQIRGNFLIRRLIGPVCRDVEGARLAWDFMKGHRR